VEPLSLFEVLSSPVRREILWLTREREMAAGEISAQLDRSPATISSHLTILREAGLLELRADGNFRRYRCSLSALQAAMPLLATDDSRWISADQIPEVERAHTTRELAVVVDVEVPVPADAAFAAFVDEQQYAQWLGVPVSIRDGRFRATMEWGTEIRGVYEVVHPPSLIAMRWDFDDDAVPLPGRELVCYLRIAALADGARVTVHQLADAPEQAAFLATAWSVVLGRFAAAHAGDHAPSPRKRRPKWTDMPQESR
jgi:DNA-binding transcriptional ArsR family regulator